MSASCVTCGRDSIFGSHSGGMCMTCRAILEDNVRNKEINKDIDATLSGMSVEMPGQKAPHFIRHRVKARKKFRFEE